MTGFGFDPFGTGPFGGASEVVTLPPVTLPSATTIDRRTTINVLVGNFLTGEITATIPVVSARWTDVLNGSGSIDVTVTADVVRDFDLRQRALGVRSFLAVEVDNRIKQAGPIWSRTWNWEKGELTLGASGFWSWLDRRVIRPAVVVMPFQANTFTVVGKSLGGIARAIVERAVGDPYCGVPVVLPADEAGDHTESWPLWSLANCGEQLRQITQRAIGAPDVAFRPRRRADDPRFIEWVMQVGTEALPALSQGGADWVFDTSAPKSSVLGITTDEDATQMAQQVWLTGNGEEEDIKMAFAADSTLNDSGWPLTEAEDSRSTVEQQDTLNEHVLNLLAQVNRPVEAFKVSVRSEAAREVVAGDYARLIAKAAPWVGDMDRSMRVKQVSGDLSDTLTLEMFPMAALL